MTGKEASQILFKYTGWLKWGIDTECEWTDLLTALSMGSQVLSVFEQIKQQRDVSMGQLYDIGVKFGQKMDGVYLSKEEYEELVEYKHMYEGLTE